VVEVARLVGVETPYLDALDGVIRLRAVNASK